jgi:hypothetical protein
MSETARLGIIHVHSEYSHDGRDSIAALHEFALARGIGFIGLTDHAEDFEPDRYVALQEECAAVSDDRVRIIAGLEYRFNGFSGLHLLALGLSRWIAPRTPADFIRQARGVTGFTIMAHPVLPGYQLPDEVRDGIDAIEVWNASYNTRYLPDPRAIRLLRAINATRPEVVATAGLDQHDARNDRGTRVFLDELTDNPLAALRAGRFVNRGTTGSFDSHARLSPLAMTGLWGARTALDLVNAVHENVMRIVRP